MAKISVLMSVYNGDQFLKESIDSILNQTFTDFEFIIINDGSNDDTSNILNSYNDKRIKIFNQKNSGLTKSLNRGLQYCSTELIARMDSDDISHPERLQIQFEKFKDKELVLLGSRTNFLTLDSSKESKYYTDQELRNKLKTSNPFSHSSVMFRKSNFLRIGGYNENFKLGQDFDAWRRLSEIGKISMVNLILVTIRIHNNSIGRQKVFHQAVSGFLIRKNNISLFKNIFILFKHILLGIIPIKLIELKRNFQDDKI